ncbi:MAG: gamma-glutamyltransferase [Pseudolabrys sp.]|nr:gamma-glutamyltransferase [Pseudolabrys sp.]
MLRSSARAFVLIAALLAPAVTAVGQSGPALESTLRAIPPAKAVTARNGMVVAQEARAAQVGVEILKKGGNAVDAAVAVGFAMAVTYPRAGNLGGGGFMVIHLAASKEAIALDYRETAPAAATPTMFLDDKGDADPKKSRDSALAIGVPGTVAGLALAHAKYGSGRLALADLIEPAIAMARNGVDVTDDTADSLPAAQARLARWPASRPIFLNSDNTVLTQGQSLVQGDLARTLDIIARSGPDGFYKGPVAQKIAAAVQAAGGLLTADDLANYRPVLRGAVRGTYRGFEILSMPPPSSGGVHLIEMLNILEGYDLAALGVSNAHALHVMIEAMKRAYADRAVFLGDPDSINVAVAGLVSKRYAAKLRATIGDRATPSAQIRAGDAKAHEGDNTTHFSVIDKDGNAVANTYTLNFSYGLGLVAEGTGVLLNNELDDFTAKPGASNAFGLVGFENNLPGPGKRPLSSMTPTIVLKDGKPVLVTGSPGGSRIITAVLQQVVNAIDFKLPVDASVSAPRLHHQWQPDEVFAEPGFAQETLRDLAARGHDVTTSRPATAVNSIAATSAGLVGAADTRTRGALVVGY